MERIEEHIQTSPQVNEPADGRAELSDKQRADDADLSAYRIAQRGHPRVR